MAGRQRANGEGSIRERYPGCWEGRYTAGYDILTGKRIQKGVFAKTRKECAAKLARAIQQDTGPYYRKGKGYDSQSLSTWIRLWFDSYTKPNLRPSSADGYRSMIENHIIPVLGHIQLSKLSSIQIQRFYNDLHTQGRLDNHGNRKYEPSTQSECLDLFATIGALRRESDEEITNRFLRAYAENADLAMKTLFFARDVRGGIGERRVFRTILKWLASNEPRSLEKNIQYIAEYGRYDDLLALMGTTCEGKVLQLIKKQLAADFAALEAGESVSLLAKWLPSVNASNEDVIRQAKRIARAMGMNDAQYRKTLSALRTKISIIENNLREKDYTFDYSKQPSKAMFKYRKAFMRNDGDRYDEFMSRVAEGTEQLHTGTLMPYEMIKPFFGRDDISDQERKAIDATWKTQEDFTGGENALVVIDGSGSMYGGADPIPATVALSLGIYYAERNTGAFQNHFITFSENPKLVEIKGKDIYEKVRYCHQFNEVANTNIQRVFELILKTAVKNRVPQKDIPAKIFIISDMEFDYCTEDCSLTNFEYAQRLFEEHGYQLPEVMFWNVASRNQQQPVKINDQGVALVSGCNPRIFSMLKAGILSPYAFMMDVLGSKRYAAIVA